MTLETPPPERSGKRLIVGISGASGAIYGIRLLQILRDLDIETHLVISRAAERTIAEETDYRLPAVRALATVSHPVADIGAAISSGSFRTAGMIILPCSVRSMSEIASGVTGSLLTRAADVVLKERRRLVLALRETPLHSGHLQTMLDLSRTGAVIAPIMPAFYSRPETLEDLVDHSVGRLLDLFEIDAGIVKRWSGSAPRLGIRQKPDME